jgi:hypothetical protein
MSNRARTPDAWATHHDEPMFFPTREEAALYCDEDESPIPLYAAVIRGPQTPPADPRDTEIKRLKKLLRDANRGAEMSSKVSRLITSKNVELIEKNERLMSILREIAAIAEDESFVSCMPVSLYEAIREDTA